MGDFKGPPDAGVPAEQKKPADQGKPRPDAGSDVQRKIDILGRHKPGLDGGVAGDQKSPVQTAMDAGKPPVDAIKPGDLGAALSGDKRKPAGSRIVDSARNLMGKGIDGKPLQEDATKTLDWFKAITKETGSWNFHRGERRSEGLRKLWEKAGKPGQYGQNWCGAFVHVSLKEAGVTDKGLLNAVFSAPAALQYAKKNPGQCLDLSKMSESERREALSKPGAVQPGDVIVFGKRGHVALAEKPFDPTAGKLGTIEGNTWGREKKEPEEIQGIGRVMRKEYDPKKLDCVIIRPPSGEAAAPSMAANIPGSGGPRQDAKRSPVSDAGASSESSRDAGVPMPNRDAGVPPSSRDAGPAGGVRYPAEALGPFRDAKPNEAADILGKQAKIGADPTIRIRERGNLEDIKQEVGRLKGVQSEYFAWAANNRGLFGSEPRLLDLEANLAKNINRLETYAKERTPPAEGQRDSPVKVLFDGKQMVLRGTGKGGSPPFPGASSGTGKLSSLQNTSQAGQKEDSRGPIPEGTYWIDPRETKTIVNPIDWPAWGTKRLTIHPFATTETFGRGGFFIHGGVEAGSAGCIDIPNKVGDFLDTLSGMMPDKGERVKLVVDYSPDQKRWNQESQPVPKEKGKPASGLTEVFQGAGQVQDVAGEIPGIREALGIPEGGFPGSGIDLFRGSKKPFVSFILGDLSRHAASAARQVENLQKTNPGVDVPLTLVTARREDSKGIGSSERLHNSIREGGLDSFYSLQGALKDNQLLPADFPKVGPAQSQWTWKGDSYNQRGFKKAQVLERLILDDLAGNELDPGRLSKASKQLGLKIDSPTHLEPYRDVYQSSGRDGSSLLQFFPQHKVFPAQIPENHCIEAYGGVLGDSNRLFQLHAKKYGFDLGSLSKREERVWTAVYFGAPGFGKNLMNQYKKEGKSLGSIIGDPKAAQSQHVQAGLVRAAEAEILGKKLGL